MIVAVPADTPVAVPVAGSIVAIVVLLLVQVPPGTGAGNVVVPPTHTAAAGIVVVVRLPSSMNTPESYSVLPASVIAIFK